MMDKLIGALVIFLLLGPGLYVVGHLVLSFLFWEWIGVNYWIIRGSTLFGLIVSICFLFDTDINGN